MAAINFPSNPAGQTPTNKFSPTSTPESTSNGITYVYDGTKWNASSSGGGGVGDLQSVTDAGNTTTNGATFGDTVQIGNQADVYVNAYSNGQLWLKSTSALISDTTSWFKCNRDGTDAFRVTGSGSATFAGRIDAVAAAGAVGGYRHAQTNGGYYLQDDIGNSSIQLLADGSADFAGGISSGSATNQGYFQTSGDGGTYGYIYTNNPGTGYVSLNYNTASNGSSALIAKDASNNTLADIDWTGSATFAGFVQSGDNPNSGTANGAYLSSEGYVAASTSSTEKAYYAFTTGNSTPSFFVTGSGNAMFAGTVTFGGDPTTGVKGAKIATSGRIITACNNSNNAIFNGYATGSSSTTSEIKGDGSATFAKTVFAGDSANAGTGLFAASGNPSSTTPAITARNYAAGGDLFTGYDSAGEINVVIKADGLATFNSTVNTQGAFVSKGFDPANYIFQGLNTSGVEVIRMNNNGSAVFAGTVTSANSFAIELEADDDTKYTSTTDADGVETRVYNGAVLDVKDRIQNVLARMDALEANELTDDATDSALLTLVANLSTRLDERDAQISAISDNADNALLTLVANISTRIDELEESMAQVPEPVPVLVNDLPDNALLSLVASLSNQVSALTSRVQTLEGN